MYEMVPIVCNVKEVEQAQCWYFLICTNTENKLILSCEHWILEKSFRITLESDLIKI